MVLMEEDALPLPVDLWDKSIDDDDMESPITAEEESMLYARIYHGIDAFSGAVSEEDVTVVEDHLASVPEPGPEPDFFVGETVTEDCNLFLNTTSYRDRQPTRYCDNSMSAADESMTSQSIDDSMDILNSSIEDVVDKLRTSFPDRWDLNSSDSFASYMWGIHRGGTGSGRKGGGKANIRCNQCGNFGHIGRNCTMQRHKPCYICGEDGHRPMGCRLRGCSICLQFGHTTDVCNVRRRNIKEKMRCRYCDCAGHFMDDCPSRWRQFAYVTAACNVWDLEEYEYSCSLQESSSSLPTTSSCAVSCFNCGEMQHTGYECRERRADTGLIVHDPDIPFASADRQTDGQRAGRQTDGHRRRAQHSGSAKHKRFYSDDSEGDRRSSKRARRDDDRERRDRRTGADCGDSDYGRWIRDHGEPSNSARDRRPKSRNERLSQNRSDRSNDKRTVRRSSEKKRRLEEEQSDEVQLSYEDPEQVDSDIEIIDEIVEENSVTIVSQQDSDTCDALVALSKGNQHKISKQECKSNTKESRAQKLLNRVNNRRETLKSKLDVDETHTERRKQHSSGGVKELIANGFQRSEREERFRDEKRSVKKKSLLNFNIRIGEKKNKKKVVEKLNLSDALFSFDGAIVR